MNLKENLRNWFKAGERKKGVWQKWMDEDEIYHSQEDGSLYEEMHPIKQHVEPTKNKK